MDYSILINLLRTKQIVTPLEKDILDTWNELQKTPFDMDSSHDVMYRGWNTPKNITS